jgi:hypothetical protein
MEDEMLNLIGGSAGMMAIMIDAVVIAGAVQLSLRQRVLFGAIIGAWVGLASGLGAAGALIFSPDQKVPLLGVLVAAPIVIAAGFWARSPRLRTAVLAIPMPVLIGLNTSRVLGVLFLALLAEGRLSGPFPYSAGLGDMITGALALSVARLAMNGSARDDAVVARWNLFGAADLVAAIALGLGSARGSPVQIFHGGVGSEAMQHLPFSLVPTVLVPFYLLTHAAVAAQLSARKRRLGHAQPA